MEKESRSDIGTLETSIMTPNITDGSTEARVSGRHPIDSTLQTRQLTDMTINRHDNFQTDKKQTRQLIYGQDIDKTTYRQTRNRQPKLTYYLAVRLLERQIQIKLVILMLEFDVRITQFIKI